MKKLGIALAALVLLVVGGFTYLGQSSQSGIASGLSNGMLTSCPDSPNCVSSEVNTQDSHKVSPLPVGSWGKIPDAISEMGGVVTRTEGKYLAAEFTSTTFRFVDDMEFRLGKDAVQVRSASRVGYSDRGANSARVAALRTKLSGNEP